MKILVLSDSHGNIHKLNKILQKELPCDYIIHCGDGVRDLQKCQITNSKLLLVSGNIDRDCLSEYERIIITTIDKYKFYITHGDLQRAHHDYFELYEEGKRNLCNIVVFGHTHKKYISTEEPILFNPGPAQSGLYGIIIINTSLHCYHQYVEN